jgi:hypothetical protein
LRNPHAWGERYIRENGAGDFVVSFDPQKRKDDRALKFLSVYRDVLSEDGGKRYSELRQKVLERFNLDIGNVCY